jgi:serine/threonine protein kinase/predicted ATPase
MRWGGMTSGTKSKPDSMLGRTLNETYTLERRIGFGGMGRVYAGKHLRLARSVAIKVLLSKFSSNPDSVERFRHEARSASALGHPNIVQVFDFNQSEDHHWYIVMELLEGEDLRALLKRDGRLSPQAALPIFREVCDALDMAHSKGLVHRDLKPSNIYLRRLPGRQEVKILDFGVAKVLGADLGLTMDGTMLGTPHYMAPEQAAGDGNLTPRVDIYAMGTVLFEMLCGRRPFEGDSPLTVLHLRATRPPPTATSLVPDLPAGVDAVLARALARDPADRFESATQLALAFEKAVGASEPGAPLGADEPPSGGGDDSGSIDDESDAAGRACREPATGRAVPSGAVRSTADLTGETILASMVGTGSDESSDSVGEASSSSVIQLKSTDELRMATIVVVTVGPSEADGDDPDEVLELTEQVLTKLATVVADFGGVVEQTMGDAIVAVFGVPKATGVDPVRAVRAGLAARELGRKHAPRGVDTRVGIQTGRILRRSGRKGVTGEVVKIADVLADECPPGEVLIGHQTFVHVRGRFDISFRDEVRVRGQRQPLRTYRVTDERDHGVVLEHRGGDAAEAPLVGRDAERDYLRALFMRAAQESQAQVVLLLAGPGMGKTRLAHELVAALEEKSERFNYFPARASELTTPSPYGLLAEVIRLKTGSSRATTGEEAMAKLVDLVAWPFSSASGTTTVVQRPGVSPATIARAIGAAIGLQMDDAGGDGPGDASSETLAECLATFLRALSRQQPIVFVLDDLHRSDEESLELVEQLLRRLEDAPVFLLALAQPSFRQQRPAFLTGFEHLTVLELRSLSATAVMAQVSALLDGAAPAGLGKAIHKRSGGNPHLVEEMVHALRDAGGLCKESDSGPWVFLGDVEDLDVPSRAEGLLQARLDQLPSGDRELVRCAAVVGSTFWEAALTSMGLERVESRLDALASTDLINLNPTSRFPQTRQWSFKSALMAEVARGNLPGRDRRQIHQAVADWLGRQEQRDADSLSLRAYHLVQANQRAAAIDLLAEAGRLAERQQRWRAALACFVRAHELASGEGDEASSLYYAAQAGRLGVRAQSPSRAVPVLEAAIARAEALADRPQQANLLQLLGRNLAIAGDKRRAREATERAHSLAEERGDLRLRFETAKALGFVLYYGDDFTDAALAFETCIEMAQKLRDADEEAMNTYNVADSAISAGDEAKALEFANRAVELCRAREKVAFLLHSAQGISAFVRASRDGDETAKAELREWLAYADENGFVDQQLDARYYLATLLEREGRNDEALAVARAALELARGTEGEQSRRKMVELVGRLERSPAAGPAQSSPPVP